MKKIIFWFINNLYYNSFSCTFLLPIEMKYIDIQKKLEKLKVFWVEDLKILDDKYDKSKVMKWKKAWHIKQIIRWYYILEKININQNILFKISNKIYSPSYISLESAFSYYNLIPEQTFITTAVSTKKTSCFNTDIWVFDYKKIKTDLFWWYNIIKMWENKILLASLEKALIDYFYLDSNIKSIDDFEFLRFNKITLNEKLDKWLLKKYWYILNSKNIIDKINLLLKYIEND